jgi:hypothetical protein
VTGTTGESPADSKSPAGEWRLPGRIRARVIAAAACALFFLAGLPLIPRLGIQNDEALFAYGVFPPRSGAYILHVAHADLPLMLMSYVGALKSWIYIPLFAALDTGVRTTRVPMLVAGAVSIWLFYLFLQGVAGKRAAVVGCLLLATDPIYLLTTCFDWGPVALQHLLAIGGLVLILKFRRQRLKPALAGGFFLLGLMLWDKALAVWSLAGFAFAGILTQGRTIAAAITPRTLFITLSAFALGASPLIAYNLHMRAATIDQTFAYDLRGISQKARVLEATADGSGLFGWLDAEDGQVRRAAHSYGMAQHTSGAIASLTGSPRRSWMLYAYCAALLLTPLSAGAARRAIVFAVVATTGAWTLMAVTANAGGSVHHTILLWPLPQMLVGASFAAASRRFGRGGRPALAAVLILLMGSNLAVLNTYYETIVRNGGAINWTDAIFALSRSLKTLPAREIYCVDWGIMGSLHLLNRGRLPLLVGSDELSRSKWATEDRDHLTAMVSHPDNVFLTHSPGFEFFPGLTTRLVEFGRNLGYRRETLSVVSDTYGRPTFEIYHFVPADRPVEGAAANQTPRR